MIKKVVETWHRVVAGELPEALDGLLADDLVFYSPIVAEFRLMERHSARTATREGRDHRPNRIPLQSVRDARFVVRDKEGARCRSGCQGG
jgi:hypothetical protein